MEDFPGKEVYGFMRKAVVALLALLLLLVSAAPALAYQGPAPYTTPEGVLMVPLAWVAEANGAQLLWNPEERSVAVFARKTEPPVLDEFFLPVKPGKTIERVSVFRAGSRTMFVAGGEVTMPAPAEIREGRLFVPAQFAVIACHI